MTRRYEVAGEDPIEIEHLVLDVNGTLTDRGELLPGIASRIGRLRRQLTVHLLSADTFGTLDELARLLRVDAQRISLGSEKRALLAALGADRCAAIGNGRNDAEMLAEARLGIAVVGPEGASAKALAAADVVCGSIQAALGLLDDPRALGATLRP